MVPYKVCRLKSEIRSGVVGVFLGRSVGVIGVAKMSESVFDGGAGGDVE